MGFLLTRHPSLTLCCVRATFAILTQDPLLTDRSWTVVLKAVTCWRGTDFHNDEIPSNLVSRPMTPAAVVQRCIWDGGKGGRSRVIGSQREVRPEGNIDAQGHKQYYFEGQVLLFRHPSSNHITY
ncbi:hypothetical protein ASPBRDRAFT_640035 [Aspergillus brasiliensis CBS 101740]|uniref:Secreted protein n=1 Tax=Aspergillus brasiliensis (strain CBS 101740 / IMI 381727 / IBT 21946) TaxID=767769 RepID=A0A1L9UDP9_ASPBC|nr:hypothetical protein ASPBRDRAFT_640035 [Aspergillus brasiliensis CBS 101740]